MKQLACIFILSLITRTGTAQKPVINEYAVIDKKVLLLPDSLGATTVGIASYIGSNFKTKKEQARAAFIWTASNIKYDIENMFAINFYESTEEKILKALKTRKGICENYAAVFNDICLKAGIKSFVIEGYTKQNGFTDYIPHVWCAALIDSNWRMFDPTWGSGYVLNGKFFRKINNAYCNIDPAVLIKSHMPFDFLWQFLYYPVTNQDFYEGKIIQNKSRPYFNFPDSIRAFERQDTITQLAAVAGRIEKNGVKNGMIFDRLHHVKSQLEYYNQHHKAILENEKQQKISTAYNISIAYYNDGINDYNSFIEYRNKQFTPEKPDAEIKAMIDTAADKFKRAKEKLDEISTLDANAAILVAQHQKAIGNVQGHLKEQQDWLTTYLSKSKSKRKAMFYEKKITWFGIPVQ
ncbi:MAG: transglutaminase domain-containing protein [Chitinophagaceae bacterium]